MTSNTRPNKTTSDRAMRPVGLDDYIGQPYIIAQIRTMILAAKQRKEPLDHVLFSGPPGLGKTSLCLAIAHEMDTRLHTVMAPSIQRKADLVGVLLSLRSGDILFLDEIHRLDDATEEILYPAMEDFSLNIMKGRGLSATTLTLPIEPFTLLGATTKPSALSAPLRDRFGFIGTLVPYSVEDIARILTGNAQRLGHELDAGSILLIAERARGVPRIANRLLRRVIDALSLTDKDIYDKGMSSATTQMHIVSALDSTGVDRHGLDERDRRYLQALTTTEKNDNTIYSRGPLGLEVIAAKIGEEETTLTELVEPYLLQCGLIERGQRGRSVTDHGREVVKELLK